MVSRTDDGHRGHGLSAAAAIVVQRSGAALLRLVPAPPWEPRPSTRTPLDLDALAFLAEARRTGDLAAVQRGRCALPDAAYGPLVATLHEHGLVAEDADATPPSGGEPERPVARGPEVRTGTSPLVLRLPLGLRIVPGAFEAIDHDGRSVARVTAEELWAALAFTEPRSTPDADADQQERLEARALTSPDFLALTARLVSGRLLVEHDSAAPSNLTDEDMLRRTLRANAAFRRRAKELHAEHDAEERRREQSTGRRRVKVAPVQVAGNVPPLSLGMIVAHARDQDGGSLQEDYDFHPRWITRPADAPPADDGPIVYLFSNYIWSHERNLDAAAELKARNPEALTVHGGPDCPSYPGEAEAYLRANPQVDVAVRGEGESTFAHLLAALGSSLGEGRPDLSALADVPGLTFRHDGVIVRTADRARIEDVDAIPSPYLTGVFDSFGDTRQLDVAIIETNRGCPYGCTFCDWGSATNSRIRKFDLDRVLAEFEWCARNGVPRIFVADANFGIFARDVEIARHVVALRSTYGYPRRFITNYAKNTVKHLREIVSTLAEGGVLSEGLLSLQSMDDDTLAVIRRSNIKLEKYDALSTEFREASLPLFVDLMMGLPGQTVASLRADFQQCVDREVTAKCHQTEMLVNSPMNDPAYRAEHRIEVSRPPGATGRGAATAAGLGSAFVVSSATFSRGDYHEMHLLRRSYLLAENFGVLRQVSRFVRQETGEREVDFVQRLRRTAGDAPGAWPYLALTFGAVPDSMVPPVSWSLFLDEVRRYLVEELRLAEGTDLDTVLSVQHALLPAPGRRFPVELRLEHDYAAWHSQMLGAKDGGHRSDWELVIDRLRSFPPATMRIDDPRALCSRDIGAGSVIDHYRDWELDSPVARALPGHYQIAEPANT